MIGKWNKSVVLTYVGLASGVLGMSLVLHNIDIKYAFICLMISGVCDMFDGTIARRCKRNQEEKLFGVELDSLVDVFSFIALPIVLLASINHSKWYLLLALVYAIFGIARLAYFNITVPKNNKAIDYYIGLPVTFTALIFPIIYVFRYVVSENAFLSIYNIVVGIVSILFVLKIKVPKPSLFTSVVLLLLFVVMISIYLFAV